MTESLLSVISARPKYYNVKKGREREKERNFPETYNYED